MSRAWILLAAITGAALAHTPPAGSTHPGKQWERVAKPGAAGYSVAKLEVLRAWLKT